MTMNVGRKIAELTRMTVTQLRRKVIDLLAGHLARMPEALDTRRHAADRRPKASMNRPRRIFAELQGRYRNRCRPHFLRSAGR